MLTRHVTITTSKVGKSKVECPTVSCPDCDCDGELGYLCKGIAVLFSYFIVGALIVFGAGFVARLMASTDLGGAGLGFVSWLVCILLF